MGKWWNIKSVLVVESWLFHLVSQESNLLENRSWAMTYILALLWQTICWVAVAHAWMGFSIFQGLVWDIHNHNYYHSFLSKSWKTNFCYSRNLSSCLSFRCWNQISKGQFHISTSILVFTKMPSWETCCIKLTSITCITQGLTKNTNSGAPPYTSLLSGYGKFQSGRDAAGVGAALWKPQL